MKLRNQLFASLFVILIFACGSASGQGHTIRGKIRNSAGVNIARTSVTLERNGAMVEQTVTNNEGDFNFGGLTDTSYTIVVTSPDYNPTSESVEFVRSTSSNEPGELRTVEITLAPKEGIRPPRAGINFVQDVPSAAVAAFEAGLKFARENRTADAIASYQNAIKLFPNYFNAHLTLANEFAKQNRLQEAITDLEAARLINPKDDRVYYLFGRVMIQQRKYAVAARIYAEAARLAPSELQYLLAQGTALIEQASLIDPATKSKPALEERVFALTEAERVLLQSLKQNERFADAHLQLARVYEKRGEPARAASELEKYLRKTPNAKNAEQIKAAIKTLKH